MVQVATLVCVTLEGRNLWHDVRFTFGVVGLAALVRPPLSLRRPSRLTRTAGQVFAFALHVVSHPLLPHSSTPLLFFELSTILTLLIALQIRRAHV